MKLIVDPYVQECFLSYYSPREYAQLPFTQTYVLANVYAVCTYCRFDERFSGYARSLYNYDEHMKSIMNYRRPLGNLPKHDASWKAVLDYTRDMFQTFSKVDAMDFHTQLKDVEYDPQSSVGSLWIGKKGPVGDENHMKAIAQANAIVQGLDRSDNLDGAIDEAITQSVPDAAYTRTQLTPYLEKLKVRNVWGEHFTYLLLEGLSAQPLMQFFKENNTFFFTGRDPKIAVPEMLNNAQRDYDWFVTFDWDAFDASVDAYEIRLAFDRLEMMLNFKSKEDIIAFKFIRLLFIRRKLIAPDGNVYEKRRGIPSGSGFTSLIGSIVNYHRILYMYHRQIGCFPNFIKVQGDDSFVAVKHDRRINVHSAIRMVNHEFGWSANDAKQDESDAVNELEFLSRSCLGFMNYRDPLRIERLALLPEHEVESGEISLFRVSSLIEESVVVSEALNRTHDFLKSKYQMPKSEEVPKWFRPYKF